MKAHHSGMQWGDPLTKGERLNVEREGDCLRITGKFPLYFDESPCDLYRQYQVARKDWSNVARGKSSPHIRFANADKDEKLIAFVRDFGPVVASSVSYQTPFPEPPLLPILIATQGMNELRNERVLYRAALDLVLVLAEPAKAHLSVIRECLSDISDNVRDWPRQWKRESKNHDSICWKFGQVSVKEIDECRARVATTAADPVDLIGKRYMAGIEPDPIGNGRHVLCELLNAFHSRVFPSPVAFHSGIRYGIRPLLYSILRQEFLYPRDVAGCKNTQCREFFEIERGGQQYCNDICSRKQRQREYWAEKGKLKRTERKKEKAKHKCRPAT